MIPALVFLLSTLSFANESDSVGKLERAKVELKSTEVNKRDVLAELFRIKRQIKAIEKERGILDLKKSNAEINITSLKTVVGGLQRKIQEQRQSIHKRLREVYKFGGRGVFRLAFSSGNSSVLDRNLKILKILTDKDQKLIEQYSENISVLDSRQKDLAKKSKQLIGYKDDFNKKVLELETQLKRQSKILDDLEGKRVMQLAKLKKSRLETQSNLQGSDARHLQMLKDLLEPMVIERKGSMPWPARGKIVAPFGVYEIPSERLSFLNKGILIQTSESAVKTVHDGVVSFSGSLAGFGKTVIIGHGDRYSTIYSNLGSLKVKTGEKVNEGQIVGSVESDSVMSGVFHFELRHFSEAKDPLEWLAKLN